MTNESRKKVLLVESEDGLAMAMDHVVTSEGHACARLSDGDKIVQRVVEEHFDLVMMDMAHSDRTEAMDACQKIRRSPELGSVKILMVQASSTAKDRRRGLALGANGMVSLPFQLEELRAEMRRLLEEDAVH